MLSKLTIAGLNSYTDGSIWDGLTLPEGIDKDVLITEIIRQASEFSVIYTEPTFLAAMIHSWSLKWYHNFERWYKAVNSEYNALYNLDVEATYTDNKNTNTSGHSDTVASINQSHQKAAYPSEEFKNAERDVGTNNTTSEGYSTGNENGTHTEKRFGNQGVTMSQDMLQAELDVWYNNIYQMIAEIFVTEFCICIYD